LVPPPQVSEVMSALFAVDTLTTSTTFPLCRAVIR
jgi:hypothetical protein